MVFLVHSHAQELQSFLGTVNFMSTFIPNLSRKTHFMRCLLKKDVHFTWTSDMQNEFKSIQDSIASAVQVTHYDPNKPAVIETDASILEVWSFRTINLLNLLVSHLLRLKQTIQI